MSAASRFFRYMNRKSNEIFVLSLQRLPFYRGQADKLAFKDDLLDSKAMKAARLPRTAYEADWPPLRQPRAKPQPE